VLLPSEAAALGQPSSPSSGLAQDSRASGTHNHGLGMAEHGGDPVASWALHIHEIAVGMLNQALQLVLPFLLSWLRVQQISCKRHLFFSESETTNVNLYTLV